jgi:hypothetical protein
MNMRSRKLPTLLLFAAIVLAFGGLHAFADVVTFTIDNANPGLNTGSGGCCLGPYATVTVDRTDSTHATITFDSLDSNGFTYLMGSQNGAGVNVSGTWAISNINATNSIAGFAAPSVSDGGSGTMDGFGNFNQNIAFFDGFTHTATELTFDLTATAATTWASALSVFTPNASGFEVVFHGFSCKDPCSSTEGATSTGFASTGGAPVPEPTSLGLSGLLVGLLAVGSRKFRKQS